MRSRTNDRGTTCIPYPAIYRIKLLIITYRVTRKSLPICAGTAAILQLFGSRATFLCPDRAFSPAMPSLPVFPQYSSRSSPLGSADSLPIQLISIYLLLKLYFFSLSTEYSTVKQYLYKCAEKFFKNFSFHKCLYHAPKPMLTDVSAR